MSGRAAYRRRSLRLPEFDYAGSGAYFVTLVTMSRLCLFGSIVGETMQPSELGQIAESEWRESEAIRQEVQLGPFVLMPNHLHAVVLLSPTRSERAGEVVGRPPVAPTSGRAKPIGPTRGSLGALVAGYKAAVTRRARQTGLLADGHAIWQRNYYEHIVRDERDWLRISGYIDDNPRRWAEDGENPDRR